MVTVPQDMVRLERMSDYRGVRLPRFHCTEDIIGSVFTQSSPYFGGFLNVHSSVLLEEVAAFGSDFNRSCTHCMYIFLGQVR